MNYTKTNNILGWVCFVIASLTYVLTLEPSASFWDCGEFISAAYKLQIVHQPGAPLFLMIQKMFSLLAMGDIHRLAYWMNVGSALSSGATILFLFWTITALVRKVVWRPGEELTISKLVIIMGSGLVGALAYTYSDSFWFSAVESEVYAMSSLCTAIVFWAILKWDAHADEPKADRWLIFIAYVMGLSIGVHLLNLLAIPAIALVYYFRRTAKPTNKGVIVALIVGCIILAVIQYGIIQYLIKFAAYFDLFFVNSLGMGFGSGVIVFSVLLIAAIIYGILYSIKRAKPILNLALVCFAFILIGYSSFAMVIIRAKANPSLNNNDPDNAFSFLSYLNREQYGDRPLLYGPYFDSKPIDYEEGEKIYRKGKEKYEVAGRKFDQIYDRNTLLPRMYSDDPQHVGYYRDWMGLGQDQSPTFTDNLGFLFSYQSGFMYARYFLWNFSGRQNDTQGNGNYTDGNWITGIKFLDALRLGPQDNLPPSIAGNNGYNRFYMLPLILGLLGAFWHFKRKQKDAGVVGLLFFFTGLAIVLYLNQTPLQPRERDYAYAGSFYAFAIWIGMGVACIADFLKKKMNPVNGAILATVIGIFAAPVLMAKDGWDDHDRSTKYTVRDFAKDYLESCAPNAILFTYGDNDTYPLWYVQEVENVRPDVRIVNLSLLGTDWYLRQQKYKVNEADPLPITMPDDKFVQGVRDVIRYNDQYKIDGSVELKDIFDIITSDNDNDKLTYQDGSKENFLPTKNFKLTINPDQVIATNTVSAALRDSIIPVMEWKYNKNYVTKTELGMIDILAHNNWKRPVYFAVTVPSSNFIGLDKYLYNEGFASRLLPLKPAAEDTTQQQDDRLNPEPMYNNMVNKFVWGNMKNARYLDPESSRMIGIVIKSFNELAQSLYNAGEIDKAKKAIDKSLEVVPDKNYSLYFTIHRFYTADMLYKLKETDKANTLVKQTADYLDKELEYMYEISKSKENLSTNDIQLGMSVLNQLVTLTQQNNQTALHTQLDNSFKAFESKFMSSMR
ncbi:DUF2723 domain-containing protein (plasmid) [Pedobacter sp. BS3]|uniref:protein O-mannosyl-transferase family n=1 Tax=Pedobacter sp. BS3 TaxID=2567937 RepID=UPI0011EC3D77|nr:DUF2723 domain-containing protein [Pedobacter sp. BS3]TZF86554.1 DUF2723 domain-containing protein [Pedobacter sp. BS3]